MTDDTAEVIRRDREHVLHPYQVFDTYRAVDPLPIARGSGVRLIGTDGRESLDAVGGMWCTNVGLGRDEMADAIAAQVRALAYANPFVDMTNVPSVDLATRLAELAPGALDHVFFTCPRPTTTDTVVVGPSRSSPMTSSPSSTRRRSVGSGEWFDIIEREGLLGHARDVGPHFMERLQELRDLPMAGDVRGSHLMACVEVRSTLDR